MTTTRASPNRRTGRSTHPAHPTSGRRTRPHPRRDARSDDRPLWERGDGFLLQEEQEALAALGHDFAVDEAALTAGHLVLSGQVDAARLGRIDVTIVYPGTFPHTRPTIFQTSGDRLGRHQNPFVGNYCLIGRSSDYWSPSMNAADLLAGLPELVELIDHGGQQLRDAEDPQGEPFSTYYPTPPIGCVIVPEAFRQLPDTSEYGTITVQFLRDPPFLDAPLRQRDPDRAGQGLIVELTDEDGTVLVNAPEELTARFSGPTWTGTWARANPDDPPPPDPGGFAEHLQRLRPPTARSFGKVRKGMKQDIHAVVFNDEIRQGVYEPGIVFVARGFERERQQRWSLRTATLVQGTVYGRETLAERIRPLRTLPAATVSVLGLGTLGAPITKLLAQSQVGRFKLADYDVVDPNTTVRWPGGLDVANLLKTHSLAQDITREHPFVEVERFHVHVGGVPSPGEHSERPSDAEVLTDWIDGADLVVESSAEDNVSRAVAAVADRRGVPQLYVYGVDGYGGVVALIRPGHTGCFHCLALALSDDGRIPAPPAALKETATRVQPRGCDDRTC